MQARVGAQDVPCNSSQLALWYVALIIAVAAAVVPAEDIEAFLGRTHILQEPKKQEESNNNLSKVIVKCKYMKIQPSVDENQQRAGG